MFLSYLLTSRRSDALLGEKECRNCLLPPCGGRHGEDRNGPGAVLAVVNSESMTNSASHPESIYPLPLSTLEELCFFMESAKYYANFFADFHLSGRIDRDRFENAYLQTIDRHQLMQSSVDLDRQGRPHWIATRSILPLKWQTEGESPVVSNVRRWNDKTGFYSEPTLNNLNRPIDLTETNGVRCRVVESRDQVRLFTQFHHSCCDGLGAFRFLTDLLQTYALLSGTRGVKPLPVIDSTWLSQGRRAKTKWSIKYNYLREVFRMPFRGLVSLLPVDDDRAAELPAEYPTAVAVEFDFETTTELRAAAKKRGTSLYMQMLCDYHWTLDRFRKAQVSNWSKQDWIRLVVPVSMRETMKESLLTRNCVSSYLIDRRHGDIDCPDEHAGWLRMELERQRRRQLLSGLIWYQKLGLSYFRKTMRRICRKLPVTSTITDMTYSWRYCALPKTEQGNHIVSDDLQIDFMDGLTPLRQNTIVSVFAMIYCGKLRIVFHYDSRFITREQLDDLISRFLERFCRHVEPQADVSPRVTGQPVLTSL